jgi:hypothetical protein
MNMTVKQRRRGRKLGDKALRQLLDRMDDLEDKMMLMQAEMKPVPRKDILPMALAERILDGEPPLRIWRERRKLSLQKLSNATGIGVGYLGDIDAGKKPGSAAALKKCAKALGVGMEDLVRVGISLPNAKTRAALNDLNKGKGKTFKGGKGFYADFEK